MKKFLVFLIVVGGLCTAGYFFYDPYLKPYLGSFEDMIGSSDDKFVKGGDKKEQPKSTTKSTQPKEKKPEPKKTVTKAAPKKAEPPKSEIDKLVESKYPMPNILPLMEIVDNWNNIPQKAYPQSVTLKDKLAFTITLPNGTKGASVAVPGTVVQPIRVSGSVLTVASLANRAMTNTIDIDKTDFKDQVVARYTRFVDYKRKEVADKRAKAKIALQQNSEKLASLQANAGKWDQEGDPRFGPVKASIASGKVPDVSIEEAKSFRWNGSERVGGDYAGTYDTVSVHFEVSTIFGKFPADYKCLLQGGRVVGWIDPLTDEKL